VRVLVSTTAGTGHFGPVIPVARACLAAGHEVVVAAPRSFAAQVAGAGFAHLPFADVPAEVMGPIFGRLPHLSFEEANAVVVTEIFGRHDAQAALPGLVEIVEQWRPDLVLREPCEFGSLVAAAAAGVPQVEVAIGMTETTDRMRPLLARPLAELEAMAGLPAGAAAEAMSSAQVISSVPPMLDVVRDLGAGPAEAVHRFRDPTLTAASTSLPEAWGDPRHPLVYVTFGSVAAGLPSFAGIYPDVVASFAGHPVRVLLTTGSGVDPADLGALPGNLRVERWWPQPEVMPHCAAMVGHGGFGTTMAALSAGVPQVVVPLFAFDQRVNAAHVAAAGAGVDLDGGPACVPGVAEAVARLMQESSYRQAAGSVASEMAALPPVSEAVSLLERIAQP
jgi:UDP:flavonoid glycosyltransferase YjiC (YdhE family)